MTTIMNQWLPTARGLKPITLTWCFCMVSTVCLTKPCRVHKSLTWTELLHFLGLFFFFNNELFKDFFWCGPFLKSLLNLLQYCFYFLFWLFGREAHGILAPHLETEPATPALEGKVSTTGLPRKSHPLNLCTCMQLFLFSLNFIVPHPFPG